MMESLVQENQLQTAQLLKEARLSSGVIEEGTSEYQSDEDYDDRNLKKNQRWSVEEEEETVKTMTLGDLCIFIN